MTGLAAQIIFVIVATLAAVAVVTKAPDGPRISRPRRPRACGHREGTWVCVQVDCDGTHHYYRRAS